MKSENGLDSIPKNENNENKNLSENDNPTIEKTREKRISKYSKEREDEKTKNRKTVHNFLYFIESINNRWVISKLRPRQNQIQKKGHQG